MKLISSLVAVMMLLSSASYANDWLSQAASSILNGENYNAQAMHNGPTRTIRCESPQYQRKACRVPSVGAQYEVVGLRKSRQLSKSPCNENIQWSFDGVNIFVQDGCRAEFIITYEITGYSPVDPNRNLPQYPPGTPGAEKCRCDAELVITRAFMDYVRRKPTMDEVRHYRIRYIDQNWNEQQVRRDVQQRYARRHAY